MSTVGFGDFYPNTDYERLTSIIVIFGGYVCFSFVNSTLLDTIATFENIFKDFGEYEKLEKFFEALAHFN